VAGVDVWDDDVDSVVELPSSWVSVVSVLWRWISPPPAVCSELSVVEVVLCAGPPHATRPSANSAVKTTWSVLWEAFVDQTVLRTCASAGGHCGALTRLSPSGPSRTLGRPGRRA